MTLLSVAEVLAKFLLGVVGMLGLINFFYWSGRGMLWYSKLDSDKKMVKLDVFMGGLVGWLILGLVAVACYGLGQVLWGLGTKFTS